jgi:hypothetical protein
LSPHRSTLALFLAFVLLLPVGFFVFVFGGLLPLAWIFLTALVGLIAGLLDLSGDAVLMIGILWAHVLILGGLLYLAAALICRLLYRLLNRRAAEVVVVLLIGSLAVGSLFDISRLPSHGSGPSANIVRVFREFAPY